jgi:hypothetical protein
MTPAIAGDLVVMVSPAPAATLTVVAPASVKAGQSFNITVTLNDQFGNVATGYRGSVHFTTSDPLPTAVVPADHTFTSADAGSRSFSVTLWTVPSQTITARDTANSGLSNTRRVTVRLI